MNATNKPSVDDLKENKREMFDGMRAYHQSEISHTNHAITMLLAIAAAAGAVVLAVLFPQAPLKHLSAISWGLWIAVSALALTIAVTSTIKIGADHKTYEGFGEEYVRTCQLLGFYEDVEIGGKTIKIKASTTIGQGKGYRRTQVIIWSFAAVLSILTFLFAVLSGLLV